MMVDQFEELKKLFKVFDREYSKYLLDEGFLNDLKSAVRNVEDKIKEIISISKFSDAQKVVHDLSIQLPTPESKKGNFDTEELGKWINGINEIISTAKPGAFTTVGYDVVAIAPGSSILLCDFDTKSEKNDDISIESVKDTKEKLISIIENSQTFSEPGHTPDKLIKFCEATKLDQEKAYKISKTLSELFPGPNSKLENVKLTVNSDSKSFDRNFNKGDRIRSIKTKQDIYQSIKPPEMEELTGKLGIMEEWDENHKISIIEKDTFRVYTTNYDPSEKNIKIIKDNIGKTVTINRKRSEDDKRKWFLERWIKNK